MDKQLLKKELRADILKQISPSEKQQSELQYYVDIFVNQLREGINKLDFEIKVKLGGSYAKDTYLKDDFDIDIFLIFQNYCSDEEKEEKMRSLFDIISIDYGVKYGSRRYFYGTYRVNNKVKFNYECVPTQFYEEVSKIENSTDASIYHVDFFNSQKKENPELHNEVRIAKQWFKSQGLYGAESYIGGFSGHALECLIITFETFENLILYLSNVNKHSKLTFNSIHSSFEIAKDKQSALMIQDPIIYNRNALSALEDSIFYKAKYKSIMTIKNGLKKEDFKQLKINCNEMKQKLLNNDDVPVLIIEFLFSNTEETNDSIGSKSKKIIQNVVKHLSKIGFDVLLKDFIYDINENKILGVIELKTLEISNFTYREGPSLELNQEIILNFLSSNLNKEIIIIKDKLFVKERREISSIKDFVNKFNNKEEFLHEFFNKDFKNLKKLYLNFK